MPTPPRVLHFIDDFDLIKGGVARAVLDMARVYATLGAETTVASPRVAGIPDGLMSTDGRAPGLAMFAPIPAARGPLGTFDAHGAGAVRALIDAADVVHLHTPWDTANPTIASVCRDAGRPYVLSPHGMLDDWSMAQSSLKKKLYLFLRGSKLLSDASVVHFTADAELDQGRKYVGRARCESIPLIFDLDTYREPPGPELARSSFPGFDAGEPVVLFLSRVHYKKGIRQFLEAAKLVTDRGVAARYIVAGPGDPPAYAEEMQALASGLGLGDRVHFVGPVSGDPKLSLYVASDLFVLPTSQENFGFVFFESLASRLPLITTKGVDTWPALERSGGAEIVDIGPGGMPRASEVADRIVSMLGDLGALAERGEEGRRWVLEEMDPGSIADRFAGMYARAMGGAGGSAEKGLA